MPTVSASSTLRDAARDATPVVLGYVPLGLAAGTLLVAAGLSWWWAPVWSLVIYSGTMQFLLVPLAAVGEPLAAIAASTLLVSGRHVFYGFSFPLERVSRALAARTYGVHAITDEVYALLASQDRTRLSSRYVLGVEAISHVSWTLGTMVGALAGTGLTRLMGERIELLGFVLTSLFVVLAIESWRAAPDLAVLALGVVAGGAGLLVGGSAALLVSLGVLSAGLVALHLARRRGGGAGAAAAGTGASPGTGGGQAASADSQMDSGSTARPTHGSPAGISTGSSETAGTGEASC